MHRVLGSDAGEWYGLQQGCRASSRVQCVHREARPERKYGAPSADARYDRVRSLRTVRGSVEVEVPTRTPSIETSHMPSSIAPEQAAGPPGSTRSTCIVAKLLQRHALPHDPELDFSASSLKIKERPHEHNQIWGPEVKVR